mmetsp:Transcript_25711/g.83051  ORF Transcript_25711/g.83051 Transcript_25711/m.83051 type:complete len:255 (+) Transcript_25711:1310-2074(+)
MLHGDAAKPAPVGAELLDRAVAGRTGVHPRATEPVGAPVEGGAASVAAEHLHDGRRDVLAVERVDADPHARHPAHRREEAVIDAGEAQPDGHLRAVRVEQARQDRRQRLEATGSLVVRHAERRGVVARAAFGHVGPPLVHLRRLLDPVEILRVALHQPGEHWQVGPGRRLGEARLWVCIPHASRVSVRVGVRLPQVVTAKRGLLQRLGPRVRRVRAGVEVALQVGQPVQPIPLLFGLVGKPLRHEAAGCPDSWH